MRYVITVSKGRRIVLRVRYPNYGEAMSALEDIEEQYAHDHTVEFKDTDPFAAGLDRSLQRC